MSNYSFEKTPYEMYCEGKSIDLIDERISGNIPIKSKISSLLIYSAIKQGGYKVVEDNKMILKEDRPAIYIANHTRFQDGPVMRTQIPNETILLVGTQRLRLIDKFFFNSTVSMYVNRASKDDKHFTKETIIRMMQKGHSFACFPEVTWNLYQDQIMLPMQWGYIDEAKEGDGQVVPMVFVYDIAAKVCHVKHLEPYTFDHQKIDIREENERIRNDMGQAILNHPSFVGLGKSKAETIPEILAEYPYYDYDTEQSYVLKK